MARCNIGKILLSKDKYRPRHLGEIPPIPPLCAGYSMNRSLQSDLKSIFLSKIGVESIRNRDWHKKIFQSKGLVTYS